MEHHKKTCMMYLTDSGKGEYLAIPARIKLPDPVGASACTPLAACATPCRTKAA